MSRPWIRPTALLLLLVLGTQLAACGVPPERFRVHDGEPPACDPPLTEGDRVRLKLHDGSRLPWMEVRAWDRESLVLARTTLAWSEIEELRRVPGGGHGSEVAIMMVLGVIVVLAAMIGAVANSLGGGFGGS